MVNELGETSTAMEIDATTHEVCFSTQLVTPKSFKQAMKTPESSKWREACELEMAAIRTMKTYMLIPRKNVPTGRPVRNAVWAFKLKHDGRFKARLCFPGHHQTYGVDYTETYSPVIKLSSFRLLLALVTRWGGSAEHLDAPNAFLNGDVEQDEVFMEQPEGFQDNDFPNHVCKLLKALYGLKQAPLRWNSRLNQTLVGDLGLTRHSHDPCVYYKFLPEGKWLITLVYVDDILVAGTDLLKKETIKVLENEFRCKSLGEVSRYVGITVQRTQKGYFLSQREEVEQALRKFNFWETKSATTPGDTNLDHNNASNAPPFSQSIYRSAIGTLMWFAMSTLR